MSFRKPCHMPFRKLIPPFTLTVLTLGATIEHAVKSFVGYFQCIFSLLHVSLFALDVSLVSRVLL